MAGGIVAAVRNSNEADGPIVSAGPVSPWACLGRHFASLWKNAKEPRASIVPSSSTPSRSPADPPPSPPASTPPPSSSPSAVRFLTSPGLRSFAEVVSSSTAVGSTGTMAAIPPPGAGGPPMRVVTGVGAVVTASAGGAGARQSGPGVAATATPVLRPSAPMMLFGRNAGPGSGLTAIGADLGSAGLAPPPVVVMWGTPAISVPFVLGWR